MSERNAVDVTSIDEIDERPELVLLKAAHARRAARVQTFLRRRQLRRGIARRPATDDAPADSPGEHDPRLQLVVPSAIRRSLQELERRIRSNSRSRPTHFTGDDVAAGRLDGVVGAHALQRRARDGQSQSLLYVRLTRLVAATELRTQHRGFR